jgi:hypothetical protein
MCVRIRAFSELLSGGNGVRLFQYCIRSRVVGERQTTKYYFRILSVTPEIRIGYLQNARKSVTAYLIRSQNPSWVNVCCLLLLDLLSACHLLLSVS